MKIQLIRHASLILHINNRKILVDPMLNEIGSLSAIENVPNTNKNPLVDLPVSLETILSCDAILVTHTHRDHFNDISAKLLPKDVLVICQPEDEEMIKNLGFIHVKPVKDSFEWKNILFRRTKGRHGHGELAKKMAPVSGYVLSTPGEPVIYLTGDTVWCSYTKKALEEFLPEIIISFCGEARFSYGEPITMNAADILSICKQMPLAKVIAVHMEAWNHCRLSRKALRDFTIRSGIEKQVLIPADGELISF
jgi:L-ascorbate metabolism protein UlaG (beta-lactamase superfamily)